MKIVSIDYKYWLANYLTQHKLGHMYVVMYQIDKNFRELLPHPVFQIRFIIYTLIFIYQKVGQKIFKYVH